MSSGPLVTVICLCYHHESFVIRALESVLCDQDYPHIQLIVYDDGSSDGSKQLIRDFRRDKNFLFIDSPDNRGNCVAFNEALVYAEGKYVIDLAADDYLLKDTLKHRIEHFEAQSDTVGIAYSNAIYINELGRYKFDFSTLTQRTVYPEGDVFKRLFQGRFICPPSVIFRTEVLKGMGGYDVSLSYEDFDIWMRMARQYQFAYSPVKSVAKRVVRASLSATFYGSANTKHLQSTLLICEKALSMAKKEELSAIGSFALYHFRLAYFTGNFQMAPLFYVFAQKLIDINIKNSFLKFLLDKKINIYLLYKLYLKIKLRDSKLS